MSQLNDSTLIQEIQKLYKARKISFSSVTHKPNPQGHNWLPNEPGDTMIDLYRTDHISINKCIEITQEVISSYKDLSEWLVKRPSRRSCILWIASRLPRWVLGNDLRIETKIHLFVKLVALPWTLSQECEISHGNITGDHMWKIKTSETWMLMTPNAFKSRPLGYDFIRSLCWWLIKVNNTYVRELLLASLTEQYRKKPNLVKLCLLGILYDKNHGTPWEINDPRYLRVQILAFLLDEV